MPKPITLVLATSRLALLVAGLTASHSAWAQAATAETDTAHTEPTEILVTAQRREERSIEVPISVSALSGDTLKETGVQQATQLTKLVPGLTFENVGAVSLFSIRGVSLNDYGDANESPVAFYVDDVYVAALAATSSQLFDVARVEVLRGPQGTLFGRNATGGLIQVVSRKPTEQFTGSVSAQYGSFNQVILEGAVGGRIADGIRFRTSGVFNRDDGWQKNLTTGTRLGKTNTWALRQLLDIDLTKDVTVSLNLHGSRTNNITQGYGFRGVLDPNTGDECNAQQIESLQCVNGAGFSDPNPKPDRVYSNLRAPVTEVRNFGASGTVRWDAGGVDITSITAFERTSKHYQEDADASPSPDFGADYFARREQFSQELRANGSSGALRWVAGAYYFQENLTDGYLSLFELVPFVGTYGLQNEYSQKTRAGAVFAQGDYDLTDALSVTAGVRYSKETKRLRISDSFSAPTYIDNEVAKTSRVTWRAAVNWKFVDNWLAYASVATGFKSPAFNTSLSLQGGSVAARPEKNINYELGLKGETADRRVQFSGAIFYTDYKDFQFVDIPESSGTPISVLGNADKARIYGVEVEVNARPIPGLTVNLNATYLNSKISAPGLLFDGVPLDGNKLVRTPEWALKGLVSYQVDTESAGKFGIRVDGSYRSLTYSSLSNNIPNRNPAYAVFNGGVSWQPDSGKLRLEAFVDNIFDKEYTIYRYKFADLNALQWGKVRTWGVRASYDW